MLMLSLLVGVAVGNPFGPLKMDEAWLEKYTLDFQALDHQASFHHWARTFGKTYKNIEEEAERFVTFKRNWERINAHNIRESEGKETFTMKLNQFGDMTREQFVRYVNGPSGSCLRPRTVQERVNMKVGDEDLRTGSLPDSIDWTDIDGKSYVSGVKDQGSCGSCWSFSTTGAIESRIAIKNGWTGSEVLTLSEQQLVDCSGSYGNDGCNGGLMDDAFKYVIASGGLCSESEYPYTAEDGTCKSSSCGTKYDAISSYSDVTPENEEALMEAVSEGPVSIAIEANQSSFQFYSSGVLTGRCGDRLDHGVLVVGYGEQDGTQFWKVKNSWGTSWGQDGYVLLCRDCDKNDGEGECGILDTPSYPKA